jgi:hypothetical protein
MGRMGRTEQKKSAEDIIAEALHVAADVSKEPLSQVREGARLMAEYLTRQMRSVAADQDRVREKANDGSRLTKHRFTV